MIAASEPLAPLGLDIIDNASSQIANESVTIDTYSLKHVKDHQLIAHDSPVPLLRPVSASALFSDSNRVRDGQTNLKESVQLNI